MVHTCISNSLTVTELFKERYQILKVRFCKFGNWHSVNLILQTSQCLNIGCLFRISILAQVSVFFRNCFLYIWFSNIAFKGGIFWAPVGSLFQMCIWSEKKHWNNTGIRMSCIGINSGSVFKGKFKNTWWWNNYKI